MLKLSRIMERRTKGGGITIGVDEGWGGGSGTHLAGGDSGRGDRGQGCRDWRGLGQYHGPLRAL